MSIDGSTSHKAQGSSRRRSDLRCAAVRSAVVWRAGCSEQSNRIREVLRSLAPVIKASGARSSATPIERLLMRRVPVLAGARPSITFLILMIAALPEGRLRTQRGLRGFPQSPQAGGYLFMLPLLWARGRRSREAVRTRSDWNDVAVVVDGVDAVLQHLLAGTTWIPSECELVSGACHTVARR